MSMDVGRTKPKYFTTLILLLIVSIYVSGIKCSCGENLALFKSTNQSSTCTGGKSAHAVDGNKNPGYGNNSCTHTFSGLTHWWQVNLENAYHITHILVTNRDNYAYRLRNLKIETSCVQTMDNPELCTYFTKNDIGASETRRLNCDFPVPGQFVRITIFPSVDMDRLTLCEVEIYGKTCYANKCQPGDTTRNDTQHETTICTDNKTLTEIYYSGQKSITDESDVYVFRTQSGVINNFQTKARYENVPKSVDTISTSIEDYSNFISSEKWTKKMENSNNYFIITQTKAEHNIVSTIDITPSMTTAISSDITIKETRDLTITVSNNTKVQPSPSLCECSCQKLFHDNTSLQVRLNILRQQLTVLKNQTSRHKRRLTCARDDRRSSVAIGAVGVVVLTGVLVMIILCDSPRIVRFLKMKHIC